MRSDLGIGAPARPGGKVWDGGSPGAWHTRAAWATMPGWLVMTAWHTGPGYRRDANTRSPPDRPDRPCFPVAWMVIGVPWRLHHPQQLTVARDRHGSPERRVLCPAGGPGRAAAQAEDGRRVSPGRSRIGCPAAGSIG
jgi:hypothetical protein